MITWKTETRRIILSFTLYQGNCFDFLPIFEANTFDAIITDPPYSSGGLYIAARQGSTSTKYFPNSSLPSFLGDNKDQHSWITWMHHWLRLGVAACKSGAVVALFTDWRQLPSTSDALQMAGVTWRGIIAWDKKNAMPQKGSFRNQCEYIVWGTVGAKNKENNKVLSGAYQYSVPSTKIKQHQTQKPIELMREILKIVPENGTILDPFMGSGSTLVAAKEKGLNGVRIELDAHYFKIAKDRLDQTDVLKAQ